MSISTRSTINHVYAEVVEDVIKNVRDAFMEECIEESVLDELKQLWQEKIRATNKVKEPEPAPAPPPVVKTETPTTYVPIQVKLPASDTQPARELVVNVPAECLRNNQLQSILTGQVISQALTLPVDVATTMLQEHINRTVGRLELNKPRQLDGVDDSEGSGDESDDVIEEEEDEEMEDEEVAGGGVDDDPLNSDDDISEEDVTDMYDTDNVIVCQYDKITRSRNKWKFFLKDGIVSLKGTEMVFNKSIGEAEW